MIAPGPRPGAFRGALPRSAGLAIAAALLLASALASHAAGEPYSVGGRWYAFTDRYGMVIDVDELQVTRNRRLDWICDDPVVKRVDDSLALVDCLARGKSIQMTFAFRSADRADLLITGSLGEGAPVSMVFDARRESAAPLPDSLVGTWTSPPIPSRREPSRTVTIELLKNLEMKVQGADSFDGIRKGLLLAGSDSPATEIYVDLGRGSPGGGRLRFLPLSPDLVLLTSPAGGIDSLLYREGKRPAWLPTEAGMSAPGICDGIADPALRERCLMSRGQCDGLNDAAARDKCRETLAARSFHRLVQETKANLGGIRSVELAYFAEYNVYVGNQPPTPVADRRGNDTPTPWVATTRFSILGYAPEGKVPCSYMLDGVDNPTPEQGFTARAVCDLDRDGQLSVWSITNKNPEPIHTGDDY